MSEGGNRWKGVWSARSLDPRHGSLLAQLLAADGFDTGFGDVQVAAWTDFVNHWADLMNLDQRATVFEVGCGAGAFLYPLSARGCQIGGIDQSAALVDVARRVLPDGRFLVGDAAELPLDPPADAVVSSSVFEYFSDTDYAADVIHRMVEKTQRSVLIADLPDLSTRDLALAHRIESIGGRDNYDVLYDGLDHLYYDRAWVERTLRSAGLDEVHTADQNLAVYSNGRFRFNAWGFRR